MRSAFKLVRAKTIRHTSLEMTETLYKNRRRESRGNLLRTGRGALDEFSSFVTGDAQHIRQQSVGGRLRSRVMLEDRQARKHIRNEVNGR